MAYDIGIIGTGYVGLVTGTCFAETGNNVTCIDIVEEKVEKLRQGIPPIFEPGLERILRNNIAEDRLHFSTKLEDAVMNSSLIFLCLPTPPNEDGSADLHHVMDVAKQIAEIIKEKNIGDRKIVVNKSTVPVGTADKVRAIFESIIPDRTIDVVSNPEFLREGFAIEDSMKPERVVVGTRSEYVKEIMRDLYAPFLRSGNPIHIMDEYSSEITKYAANSFLSVKISFMNDLSRYCEEVGADIEMVRKGIGSDTRIGKRFLFAGIGYGGSCFPKDVRALIHSTAAAGHPLHVVQAAHEVNGMQILRFYDKISKRFNADLSGKKIALWGLAFKPNTDDTREAPAFTLIDKFLEAGAKVIAYDQEAAENTRLRFADRISYASNMYECTDGADFLVIATEWNVFRNPDFKKLKSLLKEALIFDGRNLYEPDDMEELGFEYYCIGRRAVNVK